MSIKDSYSDVFNKVDKVLVVLAHPDDMEIVCGGTITRLIHDNKNVQLVVMTTGGKGMKDKHGLKERDFGEKRVLEQQQAGIELGIKKSDNYNLGIPDGELEATVSMIGKISFHIRQFKPDAVITHSPQNGVIDFFGKSTWVNHRDHRYTGQIVLDAVYPYARDRGFFPEHFTRYNLSGHSVNKVLLADSYISPHLKYFSINEYLSQKKKALQKHITAFDPVDADDYLDENKFGNEYFEPLAYYEIY